MATDDKIAWLDTIGEEVATTFRERPGRTIVPAALSTGGARAMAVFAQLAGRSPGASVQLVHGKVIGEGGMGVVRSAEQVSLGRTVAVKTLKRPDPQASLDLLREAWVTGAIEHPNVVPIHFVEVDAEGMPLVVMKRIEGVEWGALAGDAAEVERRYGATDLLAWNLGVLMQVLNAVRFAHHRGVIHRDLKPSNVMIGDYGEVYLLDWGIAVSLRDDGSGRFPLASEATDLAGTPCYMAPEMLGRSDGPPLSERTDVYLAGAVLHELLTGRVPHEGSDVISLIASVVTSNIALPASVPAEIARVCERALARDPAERYPTAEALRLAIQAYLEHRGSTELGARARSRLDELAALLASPGAARDDIYRAFGACRFGFHEALAVWRDNAEARRGLERATIAVVEYELAANRPAAALSLLADVDAPELAKRAHAAAAASAKELAALEQLRDQHDPAVGRRTRSFLAVLLGIIFTVLPIVNGQLGVMSSPLRHALWSYAFVGVLAGIAIWARRTLSATVFNRRLTAMALFLFVAQGTFALGAGWLGATSQTIEVTYLALWMLTAGMMAIALDAWLALGAGIYLVAFLVATRAPELRSYLMALSNCAFAITAYVRWRPASFHPTEEERIRFAIRPRR